MPANSFPLPSRTSHRDLHERSEYARCTGLDLLLAHVHRLTPADRAACNTLTLESAVAKHNVSVMEPRAQKILDTCQE